METEPLNDRLNPVKEACKTRLGGISGPTFYREVKAGNIEIVKIGRLSFIRESEIQRYLNSLPRGAVPREDQAPAQDGAANNPALAKCPKVGRRGRAPAAAPSAPSAS